MARRKHTIRVTVHMSEKHGEIFNNAFNEDFWSDKMIERLRDWCDSDESAKALIDSIIEKNR